MYKPVQQRFGNIDYFILTDQKKYISHAQVVATIDIDLTVRERKHLHYIHWKDEQGDEFVSPSYELGMFANFLGARLQTNPEYAEIIEDIAISS